MIKMIAQWIALAMVALLFGCQTVPYKPYARRVKVVPNKGGVVALKLEHRTEDRTLAENIMSKSCSNNYNIIDEGEVVIGTQTTANEKEKAGTSGTKVGSLFGIPVSTSGTDASKQTNSVTVHKKEWQINYKCARVAKGSSKNKRI